MGTDQPPFGRTNYDVKRKIEEIGPHLLWELSSRFLRLEPAYLSAFSTTYERVNGMKFSLKTGSEVVWGPWRPGVCGSRCQVWREARIFHMASVPATPAVTPLSSTERVDRRARFACGADVDGRNVSDITISSPTRAIIREMTHRLDDYDVLYPPLTEGDSNERHPKTWSLFLPRVLAISRAGKQVRDRSMWPNMQKGSRGD